MNHQPKKLYIFRHAFTKKGEARGRGSHLSQEGIALAKRVGACIGPIDYVLCSTAPRSIETAIAMGYAVDDTSEFDCKYVPDEFEHHQQWSWENPYTEFHKRVNDSESQLSKLAQRDLERWMQVIERTPEKKNALIISHGGSIEPVLTKAFPDANHAKWGDPFSHCDGVCLTCNSKRFESLTWHRVDSAFTKLKRDK